jgi:hypothetical protein
MRARALIAGLGLAWAAAQAQASVRNPFAAPGRGGGRALSDKEMRQGPDYTMENVRWESMPQILITGATSIRGKRMLSAKVEGVGSIVFGAGDRIVLPVGKGTSRTAWFLVRSIEERRFTIQLDDGSVVTNMHY